jgi:hypothetical protein
LSLFSGGSVKQGGSGSQKSNTERNLHCLSR